ncbi:MAG: FixH family protein [Sulfitobacter sp.]
MKGTLTGWHVLAIFVSCFGIIIAVNLTLAFQAVSTFPGLVTKNSYVASQSFDADRSAQDALGWEVQTELTTQTLTLSITGPGGPPLQPVVNKATLGRATHVAEDIEPRFVWDGQALVAATPVAPGYWTLWLELTAQDGTAFRRRIPLTVEDPAS